MPDLPLDPEQVRAAVGIFNLLVLPDVPGNPPLSEAAGDWFRDIVGALLGSVDRVTRRRMVRELFVLTPKKQAKTTFGGAMMLTALLLNQRPLAEYVLTAPSQEISDIAFTRVAGMIELDPEGFLQKRMHVRDHLKTIEDRRTKAKLKIKTFDASIVTGTLPAGVLIDELHEIAKIKNASRIIGQLRGGMLPNPEAFLAFITTQSDVQPSGAFLAELSKARAIRDGKRKGRMLPVLYEFPKAIAIDKAEPPAWQDPANWPMVTPNLGKSVQLQDLVADFEEARETSKEELQRWASQHLNIQVGVSMNADRWVGADHWEKRGDPRLTLQTLLGRSDVVVVGIDGGGLDDLLGLAVLGRDAKTREWLLVTCAWVHESVLTLRKSEAERFRDFERDGDLVIVAKMGDAIEQMADTVKLVDDSGLLHQVGVDPVGIGAIVDALAEREIENVEGQPQRVVGISQGWKLNGAIKTMEVKLADGTLTHAARPFMAWVLGNAKAEPKGSAITITKQASGTGKIDPLMASLDAAALMSVNPEARGRSIYDDPERYAREFERTPPEHQAPAPGASADWDAEILKDVRHPLFAEHKARFERWQDQQGDDL